MKKHVALVALVALVAHNNRNTNTGEMTWS